MATYLEAKNQILQELLPFGNPTVLDTAVSRAIISAQKFHENLNTYWFTEDSTAIVSVVNQDVYTLSSNIVQIYSLAYTENSSRYFPVQKPLSFVNELKVTPFTAIPRYYSIFKKQLTFYPIPSGSRTVSISFQQKIQDPPGSAGGSSTTRWFQEGLDLIISRAKILVFENVIRDFTVSRAIRAQESEILEALINRNDTEMASGNVVKYI